MRHGEVHNTVVEVAMKGWIFF